MILDIEFSDEIDESQIYIETLLSDQPPIPTIYDKLSKSSMKCLIELRQKLFTYMVSMAHKLKLTSSTVQLAIVYVGKSSNYDLIGNFAIEF